MHPHHSIPYIVSRGLTGIATLGHVIAGLAAFSLTSCGTTEAPPRAIPAPIQSAAVSPLVDQAKADAAKGGEVSSRLEGKVESLQRTTGELRAGMSVATAEADRLRKQKVATEKELDALWDMLNGTEERAKALIRAGEGTDFDVVIDTNEIDIISGAVAAFYTDDLHPNPTGNRIIAQHVAAALELPGGIPRNTVMPVITGTAAVDAVLTASSGTWTATPSSYAYQWTQDGADISGATTETYTVLAGDSGKRVACRVTATNASGEAEMTSLQTLIP